MKHNLFFHIAFFALALAFLPLSAAHAKDGQSATNQGPAHVGIHQRREEFRESIMGKSNKDESAPAAQIEPAAGEAPAADDAAAAQEQPENAQAQEPAADENK